MGRKRNGLALDVLSALAKLPWWLCLIIAIGAWLVLNPIADNATDLTVIHETGGRRELILNGMLRSFALFGQYLIPVACVFGAILSLIGRIKRKRLLRNVTTSTQPGKVIDGLSWQRFEMLIGEAFRDQGYTITETGGRGADGGIDLVLRKEGEKYLVQCKHWRSLKVGVPVIREFFGAMAVEGATGGFVVASGQFTSEAKAFAQGRNIELLDGAKLKQMMPSRSPKSTLREPANLMEPTIEPISAHPACPRCNGVMIKRTAKKGSRAGNVFWSCGTFPKCRGVVNT